MHNVSNYAHDLRCIGQALQNLEIEAFELESDSTNFRLLAGDPRPPYTALLELKFSPQKIAVLDREGRARRGKSSPNVRFDSIPEMLRSIGAYVDNLQAQLRRLDNSGSILDDPTVSIEYETRTGGTQAENLKMSFIRDTCVRMYKRRSELSSPINMVTRKR
jgi:hypothetical protein